ncbi:probable methyltransferase PMT9 isoform X2 [Telopea speciosissima]|uniref:probable methyltransferase PMT9 isoform X2 n=1 Tax=Telopea speciosissima TaxID=54955 RepID=UPI001CC7F5FA|nr:probable methyltransferase PMT9 isoform X2 [Telopea speciosissima]
MKHMTEILCSRKLFSYVLIALIVSLGLLCVYYVSSLDHALPRSNHEGGGEDGTDPLFGRPLQRDDDDFDNLFEDQHLNLDVPKSIPVCDMKLSDLIPCLDRNLIYQLKLKINLTFMEHYERHCPPPERRYNCLIPPPVGYKMLKFPGDKLNNGGNIRNVLDVGCGVASFGAYLLSHNIIAMSIAPNDVHENQIQFALERGIPSTLAVLGTKRLPYPSRSFELAHCSRCRIDWLQRDGILLLELDRLLRPGGYFVYSSPEAYAHDEVNRRIWSAMSDLLRRMCWRIVSKRDQTVIWAKPLNNNCYLKRDPQTRPPLCSSKDDPDASWNITMKACMTPYSANMHRESGSGLLLWPQRLTAAPHRLEELGVISKEYQEDTEIWNLRVTDYWKQMKSVIQKNSFRNVMDMKSNLGGFAAALKEKDVWVMNVAPLNDSSKLKIIYDRGLIGTVHDWCQSFSTYPRTFDLLHAWTIFSEMEKHGCSVEDLLIEMDRILRPDGFVIIRDRPSIINYVRKFLTTLRWDGWLSEVEPRVDALSSREERVLIARKKLWEESAATM